MTATADLRGPIETANPPADAVAVRGLTKTYGSRCAVDGVSFRVPRGSVTGLIGPNGAGKTTIMAMLLGLVRPSAGAGEVLGHPLGRTADYLGRVGALIETPAFHPGVSGLDNLRALSMLGRHRTTPPQLAELLDLVGLAGRGGDKAGSYSLGMKQRLGIAAALLGDPELVILDEPTNGLDPVGMQDMRRLIGRIAEQNRTVIVSSHLLPELEQISDWLVVLDRGGLIYQGGPDEVPGPPERITIRPERTADTDIVVRIAADAGLTAGREGASVSVVLDGDADPGALAADLNRRAHAAGIVLAELHHDRSDLETRYLSLVDAKGETQ